MIRPLRHSFRLLAIALIFAWEMLPSPKRKGERLASALKKLGPAFIKLGQVLSTRSDIIGDEMAADLSSLRDNLPPFPTATARAIIEEEFGAALATLYRAFDDKPVAAASIAQVHRAVTHDGQNVAVKILRPRIAQRFERDLDLFFWIAEKLDARPRWRRMKAREVVNTLKESVFFELDLRFEAAAADELAGNLARHDTGFRVPKIHWPLTSRRVLTMAWVEGIPLADVAAIRASGIDPDAVLAKAARSLFAQVFKDGFFHADLHPGNLFVDTNGDLVAVDFGIMGRLNRDSRLYIAEILRGFIEEDYRRVAEVHFDAGYVPAHKSLEMFTQACRAVGKPITGRPLNEISVGVLLGQMFKIAAEFEMETQPQLLLLQKTMMVTEGVGRMLNPNLNMWKLAEPMIQDWVQEHFGMAGKFRYAAEEGYDIARKFPSMLRRIETAIHTLSDPAGIRLHPHSIEKFNESCRRDNGKWLLLGWAGLMAIMVLGAALIRN